MKSTYLPYSGREGEIKNRNLCLINIAFFCKGVLFYRRVNGKWGWHENGNEDYHSKYEGEIENGKPKGQGTYTFPDGRKYVGEWKNGTWNGEGTYSYPDGRKHLGEFREGKEWNVIEYDQNGNEKKKWVNGKIAGWH